MRRIFLITALMMACTSGIAKAEAPAAGLYDIGRDYCAQSLARDIGGFDAAPVLRALKDSGTPQNQFCDCIGTRFHDIGDDEMAAGLRDEIREDSGYEMMRSFLDAALPACLPAAGGTEPGLGIDLGLSDDDLNVDISDTDDSIDAVLADNDFAPEPGDIHACLLAFDDAMMLPGFDPSREMARLKAAGQSRDEVCSCAASYIASLGDPFQLEVEEAANPQVVYGSALAGGIGMCING